ncbi:unnamed protein product [Ilex paraguariensis]|uniref:Transposase n=1 Tax=Ilex paraguariensis TaxID=185542 RepID=A0ABC8TLX7_9AQUA
MAYRGILISDMASDYSSFILDQASQNTENQKTHQRKLQNHIGEVHAQHKKKTEMQ